MPLIRETMKHQCVSLDCYPYAAGSTMIRTDRGMLDGRVLIASSDPHPGMAGRDLDDIAREWGVAKEEAARRLQPGSAIYFYMAEDDVQRILAFDETMIGSDGVPVDEKPHPRLWGTFPRVLGHYSRDVGLFPLETAVWKMTGLTARNFGLADRGTLKPGQAADIVVFDAATVRDTASYANPTLRAEGIHAVVVNGAITWRDGVHQGAHNGQVLTRGGGFAPSPLGEGRGGGMLRLKQLWRGIAECPHPSPPPEGEGVNQRTASHHRVDWNSRSASTHSPRRGVTSSTPARVASATVRRIGSSQSW